MSIWQWCWQRDSRKGPWRLAVRFDNIAFTNVMQLFANSTRRRIVTANAHCIEFSRSCCNFHMQVPMRARPVTWEPRRRRSAELHCQASRTQSAAAAAGVIIGLLYFRPFAPRARRCCSSAESRTCRVLVPTEPHRLENHQIVVPIRSRVTDRPETALTANEFQPCARPTVETDRTRHVTRNYLLRTLKIV